MYVGSHVAQMGSAPPDKQAVRWRRRFDSFRGDKDDNNSYTGKTEEAGA